MTLPFLFGSSTLIYMQYTYVIYVFTDFKEICSITRGENEEVSALCTINETLSLVTIIIKTNNIMYVPPVFVNL